MSAAGWLQASCALFPAFDGGPFIPWTALSGALEAWRAAGLVRRFWFVRKPPGLRLRIQGPGPAAALRAEVAAWLLAAERRNDLRGFRFTVYEPETYRFGGAAGMEIAHAHFDAGAALALAYETLPDEVRAQAPRHALSLALTADLLARCLDDRAEAWDVWCRLRDALPASEVAEAPRELWTRALRGLPGIAAGEHPALGALLARAEDAHAATARSLRALADSGALRVGPRAWLAAAAVFEWNRLGLPDDLPRLRAAVLAATEDLAPGTHVPRDT